MFVVDTESKKKAKARLTEKLGVKQNVEKHRITKREATRNRYSESDCENQPGPSVADISNLLKKIKEHSNRPKKILKESVINVLESQTRESNQYLQEVKGMIVF